LDLPARDGERFAGQNIRPGSDAGSFAASEEEDDLVSIGANEEADKEEAVATPIRVCNHVSNDGEQIDGMAARLHQASMRTTRVMTGFSKPFFFLHNHIESDGRPRLCAGMRLQSGVDIDKVEMRQSADLRQIIIQVEDSRHHFDAQTILGPLASMAGASTQHALQDCLTEALGNITGENEIHGVTEEFVITLHRTRSCALTASGIYGMTGWLLADKSCRVLAG